MVADALGDLLYVVLGSAVCCGIDIEPIFREIHRSNMSKLWTSREVLEQLPKQHSYSPGLQADMDAKTQCVKNSAGKVIKSPSYSRANLEPIIREQLK